MDAKELVKKHEGLRLKPYKCTAGKTTIGYGRNLDDKGISELEAEFLFNNDFHDAQRDLAGIFDHFWEWHKDVQSAMTSMMFNLGKTRFLKFKKMILAGRAGDWGRMVEQIRRSLYAKQVPSRAEEICNLISEST